ncbi:Gfo/Idh/MocA family oxidoreductase [Bacillus sp. B15-48]|uniref:Gfo/Idh/MocA family protein n=1 Tax=Bacillus sp. B15-48 TaxID=1548601 RepID=UPI00193F7BF0|nr:Gfo/Idh/MocA family oxidoreductase [Bacillus sp. B15-48]MBM4763495.1 gfo/Idh/MocA family oxidoreductase [Bacillus sp. B15-48]
MRKIRWGVLSTAKIARTQLIPAITRTNNAQLVSIASSNKEVVQEIAATYHIPKVYDNYKALIEDPEIDAVYIPLPNHMHKEWVLEAANHSKHILCEKPVSLTTEEALEMVAYCREKNVKFMEAYMYQFHPQHERVREIIASGEIGEVKLMKSSHSFYLEDRDTNIRFDKNKGGGSLYDVGCYSIHVIRHILQTEPVKVFTQAEIDSGIDKSTQGFLTMENGVRAMFDCSLDMVRRNEYEVIGTKGTIKVPFAFRPDMANGGIGIIQVNLGETSREEKISGDAYMSEVEHLSEVILNDGTPAQTGENTIQNMRVIDACYESIKTGEIISL